MEAIVGVLGALIGALAAYGGVVHTQRETARREKEARERSEADQALIAARILQAELAWSESRMSQAVRTGKYWSARYALQDDSWHQYRESIARSLAGAEEWSTVRDGFRSIGTAELQASKRRTSEQSRPEVNSWGRGELEVGLQRVTSAIEVLAPIAKDRPRAKLGRDPDQPEAELMQT